MRGSIQRKGAAKWRVIFDLPHAPGTPRRQQVITINGGKKDAQRELTRRLDMIEKGYLTAPAAMTMSDLMDNWFENYVDIHVSAKTAERYREIVDKHLRPALGSTRLRDLKPIAIQNHISSAMK